MRTEDQMILYPNIIWTSEQIGDDPTHYCDCKGDNGDAGTLVLATDKTKMIKELIKHTEDEYNNIFPICLQYCIHCDKQEIVKNIMFYAEHLRECTCCGELSGILNDEDDECPECEEKNREKYRMV